MRKLSCHTGSMCIYPIRQQGTRAHLQSQGQDLEPLRVQGSGQAAHELSHVHDHLAQRHCPFALVACKHVKTLQVCLRATSDRLQS